MQATRYTHIFSFNNGPPHSCLSRNPISSHPVLASFTILHTACQQIHDWFERICAGVRQPRVECAGNLQPSVGNRPTDQTLGLRLVDLLFDIVKRHLKEGESIHIVGFGTFEVVNRKPRRGRNPVTGEAIQLAGHRALVFRPSRSLRSV